MNPFPTQGFRHGSGPYLMPLGVFPPPAAHRHLASELHTHLDSAVLVVLGCGLTNPLEFLPSSGRYTTCCTLCYHAPRYRGALRLFPQFDGVAGPANHPRWLINACPTSPPLLGDFYKPVIQTGPPLGCGAPRFAT
jgi:hypothetical protein